MKAQLEAKNAWLKGQLQERENQLASMASLSLEAIQCRMPAKSYALYLKEQWLQIQIKTVAQEAPCHSGIIDSSLIFVIKAH